MTAGLAAALSLFVPAQSRAQEVDERSPEMAIPRPDAQPLTIDFSDDPVLALGRTTAGAQRLRALVRDAVEASPRGREAQALEVAARARVAESRAGYLPTIDVGMSAFKTLERNFSDDPFNLIERSRPRERVDFTFSVAQPLVDFGRTDAQVAAALDRLRAAGFDREARVGEVASDVVTAWSQVFAYQALERLVAAFITGQDGLDEAIEVRIARGVAPEGDRARVASLRAQAEVQLARIARLRAGAEARFEQVTGIAAPARLMRPPLLDEGRMTRELAVLAAEETPQVRSAQALADAQAQAARAAGAERYPTLGARVDHGRYGIYEAGRDDYDTRATLSLNWRILGGGAWARTRAAQADAQAADALADRIEEEARRDAAVAWADVRALETEVAALEQAYKAARQSRDVVIARFSAVRGTLFDVAAAQNAYLDAASAFIRALSDLDQARYLLLLRTGRLTDALAMDTDVGGAP